MFFEIVKKPSVKVMSCKRYYRETYGPNVEKLVDCYGKCLLKLSKFRNHVVYSARCKKVGVLPHSLRIKSPVASARGYEIARKAGYKFLNERLRLANRKVEQLEENGKQMEVELKSALSEEDLYE